MGCASSIFPDLTEAEYDSDKHQTIYYKCSPIPENVSEYESSTNDSLKSPSNTHTNTNFQENDGVTIKQKMKY